MAQRFMVGLVLAGILSGCGGNSPSDESGTATVAFSGIATATPIILQGIPANTATVGNKYSFEPTVSLDTGVVTFAIEALPAWASFDTSTGKLSGTPGPGDVGLTGEITITATDGSNTGSVGPFTVRVNAVPPHSGDAPPTIAGKPASTVMVKQSYTFQPKIGDAAGNPLTVSIANCPTWASFNTASGKLSGTPSAAQVGTYANIVMTVSDETARGGGAAGLLDYRAPERARHTGHQRHAVHLRHRRSGIQFPAGCHGSRFQDAHVLHCSCPELGSLQHLVRETDRHADRRAGR